MILTFFHEKTKGVAFLNSFRIDCLNLFFYAREKNPDSPFYKDKLPLDLFKEIFYLIRKTSRKHEWEIFLLLTQK